MKQSGEELYVGCDFTNTGDGTKTGLNRIARFDTTPGTWYELPNQGMNDEVEALAVSNENLYIGGFLTGTGDGWFVLGEIVRYIDSIPAWITMPNQGFPRVYGNTVYALLHPGMTCTLGDFSLELPMVN
jgi:hypothetical protein